MKKKIYFRIFAYTVFLFIIMMVVSVWIPDHEKLVMKLIVTDIGICLMALILAMTSD